MAKVTLEFSELELLGLEALTSEGAEGLLTDSEAAKGYIGNKAAIEAATAAFNRVRDAAAQVRALKRRRKRNV